MKEAHFLYLEIFIECNDKYSLSFDIYIAKPQEGDVQKEPGSKCAMTKKTRYQMVTQLKIYKKGLSLIEKFLRMWYKCKGIEIKKNGRIL